MYVGTIVHQGTEKSVVVVCVYSGKLPATIYIGTRPNLETPCNSKISGGTFWGFFEILAENGENTKFLI